MALIGSCLNTWFLVDGKCKKGLGGVSLGVGLLSKAYVIPS